MSIEAILYPEAQSNVPGEHCYNVRVTFGSTSIASYRGAVHNTSIVRNSAGNYTITLPTTYNEVTQLDTGCLLNASGAVLQGVIVSQTVQTDGKLIVELRNSSGTATDPSTGQIYNFIVGVSKDPLNDKFVGP